MNKKEKPAIEVKNLSFGYTKDEPVIHNTSFEIAPKEFVGIIGPNGGGKTTLLKLLLGFIKPWKGSISIFGHPPQSYPNSIAYVPQNLRFDRQFPITVIELVLEGRLAHLPWWGKFSKKDREKALQALEMVGLAQLKNRPFGTLSGGQAQRVLIARALAQEPEILFLDEPTANVDVQAESDIRDILYKVNKTLTILMVTHDIRAVISQVGKVLCIQGKVEYIAPQALCEHFALGLYHFPLIETPLTHLKSITSKQS